ncbi:hypothetical protein FRB94_003004 [Tulasnella sp. JGI-2019a]|nr:hypothetical protein FRB94_003004 [Tulasnella sp. JGI-2019a]
MGSFVIQGPPSYQNGLSIEETRSARKPDGLALLAESLDENATFIRAGKAENKEEWGNANVEDGSRVDLSDSWRRSILIVEHKISSPSNLKSRPYNRNYATHQANDEITNRNLNLKRSLSTDQHQSQPTNKRQKLGLSNTARSEDITSDELRLTTHAIETICILGNRTHVFGILIDGFETTLWYFDRGGALSSFHFASTRTWALASLALESLTGYTIECPNFTLTLNKLLDARFSFFGQGTIVYAVKMVKPTNCDTEMNGTETDGDKETNSDTETDALLELSWQAVSRKSEWEWVDKTLGGGCPQEPLAEIFVHHAYDKLSGPGTFRSLVSSDATGFKDRELRLQVMENLKSITKLPTAEFKFAIWCYSAGS